MTPTLYCKAVTGLELDELVAMFQKPDSSMEELDRYADQDGESGQVYFSRLFDWYAQAVRAAYSAMDRVETSESLVSELQNRVRQANGQIVGALLSAFNGEKLQGWVAWVDRNGDFVGDTEERTVIRDRLMLKAPMSLCAVDPEDGSSSHVGVIAIPAGRYRADDSGQEAREEFLLSPGLWINEYRLSGRPKLQEAYLESLRALSKPLLELFHISHLLRQSYGYELGIVRPEVAQPAPRPAIESTPQNQHLIGMFA